MHRGRGLTHRAVLALLSLLVLGCDEKPPPMPPGTDVYVSPARVSDSLRLRADGPLVFRGGIGIQLRSETFGNFSGVHVSDDRKDLVAVGWGGWFSGTLMYDSVGDLSGFEFESEFPILDEQGEAVTNDDDQDAESLEQAGGWYYVGFETNNRVWRYEGLTSAANPVALPSAALEDVPGWGGFSTVVETREGSLLALTEGGRDEVGNTKGILLSDEESAVVWLRAAPEWLPVDAARMPNGDLLLVEILREDYAMARLSRIGADEVREGTVMQSEVLGSLGPPDHFEKIEAVHIAEGNEGETLVYLLSDSRTGWPTNLLLFELLPS